MKTNRKYILIASICTFMVAALSCTGKTVAASGPDVTKTVKLSGFTGIEVKSAIEVNYTPGTPTSVSVTAPKSIIDFVKVYVDNDKKLNIKLEGAKINTDDRKIVVKVTAPGVRSFEAEQASSIVIAGQVSADKAEFEASGASTIAANAVNARKLEVDAEGASTVTIRNIETSSFSVDIEGASTVSAAGKATTVDIEAAGASSGIFPNLIVVGGKLEASGASTLTMNGSAATCTATSTGASTITH